MSIQIIEEPETLRFKYQDSVLILQKPPNSFLMRVITEHTNKRKNETDMISVFNKIVQKSIVGWERVVNAKTGDELPFDKKLVEKLIEYPPSQDFVVQLNQFVVDNLMSDGTERGTDLKNLKSISS